MTPVYSRALSVLACLLLGTLASSALAFVGPRFLPHRAFDTHAKYFSSKSHSWIFDSYDVSPLTPQTDVPSALRFARSMQFDRDPKDAMMDPILIDFPTFPYGTVHLLDSGFPFRSLHAWSYWHPGESRTNQHWPRNVQEQAGFIELRSPNQWDAPEKKWLPYLPLWPGLIGNALVWGGACWIATCGLGSLRRSRRRHRLLCERCAYDLRGLPPNSPCPECGQPTPAR